jgi:hypothetical protein
MRLKKITNQLVAVISVLGMCLTGTPTITAYADDGSTVTIEEVTNTETEEDETSANSDFDANVEVAEIDTDTDAENTDVVSDEETAENSEEIDATENLEYGAADIVCSTSMPIGPDADIEGVTAAAAKGEAYSYDNGTDQPTLIIADNTESIGEEYAPADTNESGTVSNSEIQAIVDTYYTDKNMLEADAIEDSALYNTGISAKVYCGWNPETTKESDAAYVQRVLRNGKLTWVTGLPSNTENKDGSYQLSPYLGIFNSTYYIEFNGQKYTGFCANSEYADPVDDSSFASSSDGSSKSIWGQVNVVNAENVRKVLYYGYGGPGDITNQFGLTDGQRRILMDEVISYAYSGTCEALWHVNYYTYKEPNTTYKDAWNAYFNSWVKWFYDQMVAKTDPLSYGYEAFSVIQYDSNGNVIKQTAWTDKEEERQPVVFGAYAYESPKIGTVEKQETKDKTLQYKINITKTDTSGKALEGVKFKVTVKLSDTDTETQVYTTDANGKINTTMYVTRSFSTQKYTENYIDNYDKVSAYYQSLYSTYTKGKSTAQANVDKKAQDELSTWEKSIDAAHSVTWVETETLDGYKLDSTEHTETKNSGDTITGEVVNETYGKSASSTGKGEFTTTVTVDIDKLDSDTKEKLSGGQFEIWVSNYKSYDPDNPDKAADIYDKADVISAQDGKLTLTVTMSTSKEYSSGSIPYVENYESMSASNQALYRDYCRSYDEAKKQADTALSEAIAKGQSDFENATRYVKVIETSTPTKYVVVENNITKKDDLGDGVSIFNVVNGKAEGTILNQGLASLYVLKTESDRTTPIANVKLQLATKDGTVIDTWTTEDSTEPHKIDGLARETEYVLTELSTNPDYVTPKETSYTIRTGNAGATTPTYYTLVNYKVEVSKHDLTPNPVIGAKMEVVDSTGNVVDTWITAKENHQIQNLTEGQTYILREAKAPEGYVVASDVEFTVASEQDQTVEMTDTMTFVDKQGASGKTLAGASIKVVDKETQEEVDSWITGTKIVDITDEQAATLQTKGNLTIKTDSATYVLSTRTSNVKKKDFTETDTYGVRKTEGGNVSYYDIYIDGTEAAHAVRNLKQDREYTIVEVKAPNGYSIAPDIDFTPTNTENVTIDMLDTALFASKYDGNYDLLSDAKMSAMDTETNEIVDSWKTGEQLVTLTDEQKEQLWNEETVIFTQEELIEDTKTLVTYTIEPSYSTINAGGTITTYSLDTARVGATRNNAEDANNEETTEYDDTSFVGYVLRKIKNLSWFSDGTTQEDNTEEQSVFELEGASGELSVALQEDLAAVNASREESAVCTLRKSTDNSTEYYLITLDGKEAAHRVRNTVAGRSYTIIEDEAPDGYTVAEPVVAATSATSDTWTDMVDSQVVFRKVDITDDEIVGAKITVTDADGIVWDSWISTTEPHYIKDLTEGKTYTLTEDLAPLGYNKASSIEFTVEKGKLITELTMTDTVTRVSKEDETGNLVKGARLEVLDKDQNVVDSWVSGQHMIDMTDDMLTELDETGIYVISAAKAVVKYDDTTLDACQEYLEAAAEKVLGGKDTSLSEMSDTNATESSGEKQKELNASQNVHAAYELLPYDAETLQEKVANASEKILTLSDIPDETLARDTVDELMKELKSDAAKFNATSEENADYSHVYIEKVNDTKNAYVLVKVSKEGQASFIDINQYGDETTHRISNLELGATYTLHESESPAKYNVAVDMEFVADGNDDIIVTMLDTKVLEGASTSIFMDNPIIFAGIGATALLVLGGFFLLKRKNKVNNSLPDSFTL